MLRIISSLSEVCVTISIHTCRDSIYIYIYINCFHRHEILHHDTQTWMHHWHVNVQQRRLTEETLPASASRELSLCCEKWTWAQIMNGTYLLNIMTLTNDVFKTNKLGGNELCFDTCLSFSSNTHHLSLNRWYGFTKNDLN